MTMKACVFDAYGTLFDVAAAAREAAAEPAYAGLEESWPVLAADWRSKQLEYTWLRAITGAHADFWQVTQDGLDWALEKARLTDPALRARLLQLYKELSAYPEVCEMLRELKARGKTTAILSNGAPDMLASATQSAGISDLLDAMLSVEEVGIFKPAPAVYDLVEKRLSTSPAETLFVSSNGWDVCSAAAYGFRTAWVNRTGQPLDRLDARPDFILQDLTEIPKIVAS